MRIAREEVFGPVVALIEFETFEEAIEIANSHRVRPLDSALHEGCEPRVHSDARSRSRHHVHQRPTIGAEVHLPFGGVKQTGNGHREGPRRDRLLHDMEGGLRGLLRQVAARADR